MTDDDGLTRDQALTINVIANTAAYANSGGSGDRRSVITATTLKPLSSGSPLSNIIDGATDSVTWTGGSGMVFTFDFGVGINKNITEITWKQSTTGTHGTWVIEASHDNQNWGALTGNFTFGGVLAQVISLATNPYGYRYYRLRQISGAMSTGPYLHEIEFKIMDGPKAPQ